MLAGCGNRCGCGVGWPAGREERGSALCELNYSGIGPSRNQAEPGSAEGPVRPTTAATLSNLLHERHTVATAMTGFAAHSGPDDLLTEPTTNPELDAVRSLEAQLHDLYAGQEALDTELGTSDPHQIIAMVQSLRTQLNEVAAAQQVKNLEAQLQDLYARREYLEKNLGISNPFKIIELVRSMEDQLREFYKSKDATLN